MAGEKRFEEKVKNYLAEHGAWVLKSWSNGIQRKGVPDLLICHRGYFIGMEVKNVGGRFTDGDLQPWNIRKINEAGGIAGVLIPTEGKERFRRYIAKHHPDYFDTPVYDFEEFKQIIENIEREENE